MAQKITSDVKRGDKIWDYCGELVGKAIRIGQAKDLLPYDDTGAMAEFVKEKGYGEFQTEKEAGRVRSVAVECNDGSTVVYTLGEGGAYTLKSGG